MTVAEHYACVAIAKSVFSWQQNNRIELTVTTISLLTLDCSNTRANNSKTMWTINGILQCDLSSTWLRFNYEDSDQNHTILLR